MASEVDIEDDPKRDVIVIDHGSSMVYAGFAGDDSPRSVFPPIVGRPKESKEKGTIKSSQKDTFVGDEAYRPKEILTLENPKDPTLNVNWDDMEKIWHHLFYNELRTKPDEYKVLLTEPVFNDKLNRERTLQIMLEKFKVPALFLGTSALLSLFNAGNVTGIVLDAGDSAIHSVPIYEASPLLHAAKRLDIGGKDLTKYLAEMLIARKPKSRKTSNTSISIDLDTTREIKERLCYTALDFDKEMALKTSKVDKSYKLPDGTSITVGNERFRIPEILFQPSLVGNKTRAIHRMVLKSIELVDEDLKNEMYNSIVISGGTSLFQGMEERLKKEIQRKVPDETEIQIIAPEDRKYSAWKGGSMFGSLSTFPDLCVSKWEYEEYGLSVINRKCF